MRKEENWGKNCVIWCERIDITHTYIQTHSYQRNRDKILVKSGHISPDDHMIIAGMYNKLHTLFFLSLVGTPAGHRFLSAKATQTFLPEDLIIGNNLNWRLRVFYWLQSQVKVWKGPLEDPYIPWTSFTYITWSEQFHLARRVLSTVRLTKEFVGVFL